MKKLLAIITALSLFAWIIPIHGDTVLAQQTPKITCTPISQSSQTLTRLSCIFQELTTPFVKLAEVPFPFTVNNLISVSSPYTGTLQSLYPSTVTNNTVLVGFVLWGNAPALPVFPDSVPFDSLRIVLETSQPVSVLKDIADQQQILVSYLYADPATPQNPVVQSQVFDLELAFDGSLVLESFTQYATEIGVLQFLRLALACYQSSPQACVAGMISNL
ncbi:MAG: hypothetical protein Q8O95_03315 [bacterium]|nr:hypothetical protein [bacterium]